MAGRILIADAVATNRIAYKAILTAARYDIVTASEIDAAIDLALAEQPDLILMDAGMGLDGIARFKVHPLLRDIPIVALANRSEQAIRIAVLEAGAEEVMSRPVAGARLLARMRSALRSRDTAAALAERQATVRELGFAEAPQSWFEGPSRVALVTSDPARAVVWATRLRPHTRSDLCPLGPEAGLAEADREVAADIFVIEAVRGYPAVALRLLSELRSRSSTRHARIIVIHDPEDADTAAMALDLGANDLCETGFDPVELALRLKIQMQRKRDSDRLRASVDEGLRLAVVDPLTGLFNRRYAMTFAGRLLNDEAVSRGFAVIMIDIDRFKAVNDTYGHAAGDCVLIDIAARLRDNMRGMDMVARFGGEEFMVILPDTEPLEAAAAARRLCALVRETPADLGSGHGPLPVTISLGVAMAQPGEPVEAIIARADRALYRAKEGGRDCVTVSEARAA